MSESAMIRLWRSGMDFEQIGKRLGVHHSTASNVVRESEAFRLAHCPWCKADIRGTTPSAPHICGKVPS